MIDYDPRRKVWFTTEPLLVVVGDQEILIMRGFETDLSSIPRIFWVIPGFGPHELGVRPPVVHDWLVRKGTPARFDAKLREEADQIFLRLMAREGIPLERRRIAYRFVRMWSRIVVSWAGLTSKVTRMLTKLDQTLNGSKTVGLNVIGLLALLFPDYRELLGDGQLLVAGYHVLNIVFRKWKVWKVVKDVLLNDELREKVVSAIETIKAQGGDSDPVAPGKS